METAKPIGCRTLAIMREAAGLKKNELAARLGMEASAFYEYEATREPPRRLLDEAAAALGHPPLHVDRTLAYLRRADAEATDSRPAGDDAADLEIDRFAASLGADFEDFHRAVFRRSRRLARAVADREVARVHFPRLRARPAAERPALVRDNPAFQTWAVSELAAHESIAAAAQDPDAAFAWADLAVLIAELAPGDPVFRSRSRGWAVFHRANAFRVKGRLFPEADGEIARARALWTDGEPGDPERLLDEARVFGLEASLRREQRRFPEALDLLQRALDADRGGERKILLINQAKTFEEQGGFAQALAVLDRVLPLVDRDREPGLFLISRYNVLVLHCLLGQYALAAEKIDDLRDLTERLGAGIRLARLGWLFGWIQAGLGQRAEAEAAFERVRREFLREDIPYDAALVSLELAVLFMEQGRTGEVRRLALDLTPVFLAQRVSREALAALQLFREAVEQEKLTLDLVQRLRDELRRCRPQEEA